MNVITLVRRDSVTCWPTELQTQVLQSTVVRTPGVQPELEPEPEPEPEPELEPDPEPETAQEAGQVPSLPGTCSPPAVVAVLHQACP